MEKEVKVFDAQTGEEKAMEQRFAAILTRAHPQRYMTRELRALEEAPRALEADLVSEVMRRKPGRPRKDVE